MQEELVRGVGPPVVRPRDDPDCRWGPELVCLGARKVPVVYPLRGGNSWGRRGEGVAFGVRGLLGDGGSEEGGELLHCWHLPSLPSLPPSLSLPLSLSLSLSLSPPPPPPLWSHGRGVAGWSWGCRGGGGADLPLVQDRGFPGVAVEPEQPRVRGQEQPPRSQRGPSAPPPRRCRWVAPKRALSLVIGRPLLRPGPGLLLPSPQRPVPSHPERRDEDADSQGRAQRDCKKLLGVAHPPPQPLVLPCDKQRHGRVRVSYRRRMEAPRKRLASVRCDVVRAEASPPRSDKGRCPGTSPDPLGIDMSTSHTIKGACIASCSPRAPSGSSQLKSNTPAGPDDVRRWVLWGERLVGADRNPAHISLETASDWPEISRILQDESWARFRCRLFWILSPESP